MKNILLVEPEFPIPPKSKNHQNFLPIGLLKISSFLKNKGNVVKLFRGIPQKLEDSNIFNFNPDEIWITSLFTYWSKYVTDSVNFYKENFPNSKIIVGGIFASLFSKEKIKEITGCDEVYQGVKSEVEKFKPDFEILKEFNSNDVDYQIIHTSRGCQRKCSYCGTWIIEPNFISKKSIKDEIQFKKVVIYDNNFFHNEYIEDILNELIDLKKQKKIIWCESQSGFDGRILLEKPYLAKMIKNAGFRYPRIAWDGKYKEHLKIKKQLDLLVNAGYDSKEISIFVLYNWDIKFDEMENKRLKCWEWNVQIADCRFRPLDQLFDNYNPHIVGQNSKDYYIHEKKGWTDSLVKQFRKNIREQNICIRHGFPFYSRKFENKKFGKEFRKSVKKIKNIKEKINYLNENKIEYWIPDSIRYPNLL